MSTAKATPKPEPEPAPALPEGASIQTVGDLDSPAGVWKLITYGGWQISVGPDGLVMLPRHLHPREWADFVAAGSIAASVAAQTVAENAEKSARAARALPPARAIVRDGPTRRQPAAGLMPMAITPGPNPPSVPRKSAIGRPRRGRPIAPPGAMI
jgi:hypothetical protein